MSHFLSCMIDAFATGGVSVHFKPFDPNNIPTTELKVYGDSVRVPQYAVTVEDPENDILGLSVLTKVSVRVSTRGRDSQHDSF